MTDEKKSSGINMRNTLIVSDINVALNNLATAQTTLKGTLNGWIRTPPRTPQKAEEGVPASSERRELDNYRQTKIERIDRLRYRAYGANGATLDLVWARVC